MLAAGVEDEYSFMAKNSEIGKISNGTADLRNG
jgi:hypothetical protein